MSNYISLEEAERHKLWNEIDRQMMEISIENPPQPDDVIVVRYDESKSTDIGNLPSSYKGNKIIVVPKQIDINYMSKEAAISFLKEIADTIAYIKDELYE